MMRDILYLYRRLSPDIDKEYKGGVVRNGRLYITDKYCGFAEPAPVPVVGEGYIPHNEMLLLEAARGHIQRVVFEPHATYSTLVGGELTLPAVPTPKRLEALPRMMDEAGEYLGEIELSIDGGYVLQCCGVSVQKRFLGRVAIFLGLVVRTYRFPHYLKFERGGRTAAVAIIRP